MSGKPTQAQESIIEDVLHDFKVGKLKSGSGDKVTNRKQAIAIALSESGTSDQATPTENKHNLRRTLKKKRSTKAS
jgi:hypothetical protein